MVKARLDGMKYGLDLELQCDTVRFLLASDICLTFFHIEEIEYFHTCQVRAVRLYVSCLTPPRPPSPPPPQPQAFPAGPQPQVSDGSVPRRTSTNSFGWQCPGRTSSASFGRESEDMPDRTPKRICVRKGVKKYSR